MNTLEEGGQWVWKMVGSLSIVMILGIMGLNLGSLLVGLNMQDDVNACYSTNYATAPTVYDHLVDVYASVANNAYNLNIVTVSFASLALILLVTSEEVKFPKLSVHEESLWSKRLRFVLALAFVTFQVLVTGLIGFGPTRALKGQLDIAPRISSTVTLGLPAACVTSKLDTLATLAWVAFALVLALVVSTQAYLMRSLKRNLS